MQDAVAHLGLDGPQDGGYGVGRIIGIDQCVGHQFALCVGDQCGVLLGRHEDFRQPLEESRTFLLDHVGFLADDDLLLYFLGAGDSQGVLPLDDTLDLLLVDLTGVGFVHCLQQVVHVPFLALQQEYNRVQSVCLYLVALDSLKVLDGLA